MSAFHLLLLIGLCLGSVMLRRLHSGVRGTTATSVIPWCWLAWFLWLAAVTVNWLLPEVPPGVIDQFWYWAGVFSLCPAIAVLGSRKPTNRVWPWFVLAPLVVVLGWPAMTLWLGSGNWGRLQVEAPVSVGFVLVIVMGLGNYVGTRLTFPAMLSGAAICLILLPFATFAPAVVWHPRLRETGTAALLVSLLLAWWETRAAPLFESPFDGVLWEFREVFGLVWSVRILERLQEQAKRDQLKLEWTAHGLEWQDQSEAERIQAELRVSHTLRWLLRRFVTAEWLDAQGVPKSENLATSQSTAAIDS